MDKKQEKEKDFQVYVGWETPLFIKIAWVSLLFWIIVYASSFLVPAFKAWVSR